MIRITENGIWMRQGDSGNIPFEDLPKDKAYNVYFSIFNEETQKVVKEISGNFNQSTGEAVIPFAPSATNDVPVGEYTFALKTCYTDTNTGLVTEDTWIPETTVSDGVVIELPAPTFTLAVKRVEGTDNG